MIRNLHVGFLPSKALFAFLFFVLVGCYTASATHIRAGEITARRLNDLGLLYEFTFTGYRDTGSPIEFGGGVFNFGDGDEMRNFNIIREPLGNGIEKVIFQVVHEYRAPALYVVSYLEENRNDDIINIANSVNTAFYVESNIRIDPIVGLNNTPTLTVPPIDFAAVGAVFIHNPGAQDLEGDSIAYRFTIPKMSEGTEVNDYRVLNDPSFYNGNFASGSEEGSAAMLTLNPLTGDLIWNAPGDAMLNGVREYNVAFVVEEWRSIAGIPIKISEITRDMQIIVEETDNERPALVVPDAICVEAGSFIDEIITADDSDGHPVKIEAYGGPFEVFNPASFSPDPANFNGPPTFTNFTWQTVCGNVRERPFTVQFKATDNPEIGPSLIDIKGLDITVVGPAPTGLNTSVLPGKAIRLDWDEYSCSNADEMQIWRRVGDFPIELDDCEIGMPANTGYQLIKTIGIDTLTYLDNNFGKGLAAGAKYCYRLVAKYPAPSGGTSYVSVEACDSILIDVPVITNVDVLSTSEVEGEILVRWTPPYQIDQLVYPPNYTYDLFRATGIGDGIQFSQILSSSTDTIFVDTGLNTFADQYTYFVRFYDNSDLLVDSSFSASSVRLELAPLIKSIELGWSAEVPWSLRVPESKYHYIYRDQVDAFNPEQLVLIDSLDVTASNFSYLDNGRFNGVSLDDDTEYCYFVSTYGSYDNPLLPFPLINKSQISCGQPNDTIPPCAPLELALENNFSCDLVSPGTSCGNGFYVNRLVWELDFDAICDDDVRSFNVYFSSTGLEEDYILLENVKNTVYNHEQVNTYKGCYKISAVDRSGNESELTEEFCRDNCPVYKLPNVFTPNDDRKNDFFTPLYSDSSNPIDGFDFADCPRFVKSVVLTVIDRNGAEVFFYDSVENENNILINWDGKHKNGEELNAGVYYYSAEVEYDVLTSSDSRETLSGWVQILK